MAFLDDLYDALDLADITVGDQGKVKSVSLQFENTSEGKVATYSIRMKPGVVPFPPGMKGMKLQWMMED